MNQNNNDIFIDSSINKLINKENKGSHEEANISTDNNLFSRSNILAKFSNVKRTTPYSSKKAIEPCAAQLHLSCFHKTSINNMWKYINSERKTEVKNSRNPHLGLALFAAEDIEKGAFISLYKGKRLSQNEAESRQKANRSWKYMLSIGYGIVIDTIDSKYGASFANHSCDPNAQLETEFLSKSPICPIGTLRSIRDIDEGEEIECDYGWLENRLQIENKEEMNAIPCKCEKSNCRGVLYYDA